MDKLERNNQIFRLSKEGWSTRQIAKRVGLGKSQVSEILNGNPSNKQVGGRHYKHLSIQPTDFIVKNNIPFMEGNVIKYVCRHSFKNGKEDILKAIHYLNLIIQHQYESNDIQGSLQEGEGRRAHDTNSASPEQDTEGQFCNND